MGNIRSNGRRLQTTFFLVEYIAICWNQYKLHCVWANGSSVERAAPTNSENHWTQLSFRWRSLEKLERNKLKSFGSMQQHQNDSTNIRFFQRNKVCMYSIFDIAKNVFKIKSFSSLSADTYAKMKNSKKLLLSPINGIKLVVGWLFLQFSCAHFMSMLKT